MALNSKMKQGNSANTLQKYSREIGFFEMCTELPPRVNSLGVFDFKPKNKNDAMMQNELPELQLNVAMIILTTLACHFILKLFRLPKFVSQIIGGLLLGYIITKSNKFFIKDEPFSRNGQEILGALSSLGFMLHMFQSGVKMDIGRVLKTGTKSLTIGLAVLLTPLLCGLFVSSFVGKTIPITDQKELYFIVMSQSIAPFPTITYLISHLNILNSELARIGLASSVAVDAIGFVVMNILFIIESYKQKKPTGTSIGFALATCVFVLGLVLIIRPFTRWIIKRTPEGRPVKDNYVYFIILLALFFSLFTNNDDQRLMMITTLIISIIDPIFARRLYNPSRKYIGYQKRNVMHLKSNAELRVLTCIQRLNDIPGVITLLDVSSVAKESPVSVNVLHLIELIGRSTPIFISHRNENTTSFSAFSYSENVIFPFYRLERDKRGAIQVNAFTAVSPSKLMYDDVCTLALDKLTSLIILPFHRKWSMNGTIELEDNMIRALNNNVLQFAPCSVALLANRGCTTRNTTPMVSLEEGCIYSICVIFLGGKDDREGLIYAKRMTKNQNVTLTVMHFKSQYEYEDEDEEDSGSTKWEKMLDSEVLRNVKYSNLEVELKNVSYLEEIVQDGSELSHGIQSLVEDFDLIICGRRNGVKCPQTEGLAEWSEFPELMCHWRFTSFATC